MLLEKKKRSNPAIKKRRAAKNKGLDTFKPVLIPIKEVADKKQHKTARKEVFVKKFNMKAT